MTTETEALEQFFRGNQSAMTCRLSTKDFDPAIVRVEPEGFPTSGTHRGIDEVLGHIIQGRGSWAEGTCTPEKFLVNGDKIVVYLHAWVRKHGATEWMGGTIRRWLRVSQREDHRIPHILGGGRTRSGGLGIEE